MKIDDYVENDQKTEILNLNKLWICLNQLIVFYVCKEMIIKNLNFHMSEKLFQWGILINEKGLWI